MRRSETLTVEFVFPVHWDDELVTRDEAMDTAAEIARRAVTAAIANRSYDTSGEPMPGSGVELRVVRGGGE